MYAIDLNYDGMLLSDFGFIICDFDSSDGAIIADTGSTIEFNKVSYNFGKKWSLIDTKYNECIRTTFDICKNPDETDQSDMPISDVEYRDISRWLSRREFLKLYFIYDDLNDRDFRYYNASFNLQKIKINEVLYGIRLTMETNSPFAYGEDVDFSVDISNTLSNYRIKNLSDEIGCMYPFIRVICNQSGDLVITNKLSPDDQEYICNTVIRNCSSGEVITMDGETGIITTSVNSHEIQNDFNYEFFEISSTLKNRYNFISSSISCTLNIHYSPIIKDVAAI